MWWKLEVGSGHKAMKHFMLDHKDEAIAACTTQMKKFDTLG